MVPADTQVIPGHRPLSDIARLQENIDVLSASTQMIRDKLAAGDDIDTIAAALDDAYPGWSWGFITSERWAQTIQKNDS